MIVCICARVAECELRTVVRAGAHTEDAVGDACGAGSHCGTCLDRIEAIISEAVISQETPASLVGSLA